jgi:hypothetical protein
VSIAALLRGLAVAKMRELTLISAEFGGYLAVFQPWVRVLLGTSVGLEYVAAYQPAYPAAEDAPPLPGLCLRRCTWNRDEDYGRFRLAGDARAYLASGEQIQSRIVFAAPHDTEQVTALAQEGAALFRRGLGLTESARDRVRWETVEVDIADGSNGFALSYAPRASHHAALEAWVAQWQRRFESLVPGLSPDGGVRVSYRDGLRDLLAREFFLPRH